MEKQVAINGLEEMANFTFTTKYAKYDEKKQRRETWEETVLRVEKMHLKTYTTDCVIHNSLYLLPTLWP